MKQNKLRAERRFFKLIKSMMIVWGKPLLDTYWNYGSMTSAKLTTVSPTIDIGDSNAEWQLPHLVQTHHPFRQLLAYAARGKNLKHLEHVWAMLSNLEEPGVFVEHSSTRSEKLAVFSGQRTSSRTIFLRANLGHFEQFWTIFGKTIWYCRRWSVFNLSPGCFETIYFRWNKCLNMPGCKHHGSTKSVQISCPLCANFSCIIIWKFALVVAFTSTLLVSS